LLDTEAQSRRFSWLNKFQSKNSAFFIQKVNFIDKDTGDDNIQIMKICYLGTYSKEYIRNRVIIKGLMTNGAEVIQCHYPMWTGVEPRIGQFKGIFGFLRLGTKFLVAYINLFFKALEIQNKPDVLLVGYTGHFDIPLAFLFSRLWRIPLVFDFHVSLWDTFVKDRMLVKKGSLMEKLLRFVDRTSIRLSDLLFLDTDHHIEFVANEFKVEKKKFRRFWVGEDPELFHPVNTKKFKEFTVIYFGGFIPLHGMEVIVEAARRLQKKNIKFIFAGKGQLFEKTVRMAEGLKNVEFLGWVAPEKLPELISRSHVCLGIFGKTDKARRVIPNKLYEGIACAIPVVTGDTPAIREVFKHRKNIFLCEIGSGESLADALLELKRDGKLRKEIGLNGYRLFKSEFTPDRIGAEVLKELKKLKGGFHD